MTTKIYATGDALGSLTVLFLFGSEAHELIGADHLLPQIGADTVLADKAFDADERIIKPLHAEGKTAVIPLSEICTSPRLLH